MISYIILISLAMNATALFIFLKKTGEEPKTIGLILSIFGSAASVLGIGMFHGDSVSSSFQILMALSIFLSFFGVIYFYKPLYEMVWNANAFVTLCVVVCMAYATGKLIDMFFLLSTLSSVSINEKLDFLIDKNFINMRLAIPMCITYVAMFITLSAINFKIAKKCGYENYFAIMTLLFPQVCLFIIAFGKKKYKLIEKNNGDIKEQEEVVTNNNNSP